MENKRIVELLDQLIMYLDLADGYEENDEYPPYIEALEIAIKTIKEKSMLNQIREEILRKANSGQWSKAVVFGMNKAVAIIDKYRNEE